MSIRPLDEREAMTRLVAILVGREGGEVTLTEDETTLFRSGESMDSVLVQVMPALGTPRLKVVVTVGEPG